MCSTGVGVCGGVGGALDLGCGVGCVVVVFSLPVVVVFVRCVAVEDVLVADVVAGAGSATVAASAEDVAGGGVAL